MKDPTRHEESSWKPKAREGSTARTANRLNRGIGLALGALATLLLAAPAHAVNAADKCGALKLIALGNFAECRLKQVAKAVKTGRPADFSKCDRTLDKRFQRAAQTDRCTVPWNAEEAVSTFGSCTQRSVHAAGADTLQAPGWWCPGPPPDGCKPICGDGIQAGTETCDDGNTLSGDGCSARCQIEGSASPAFIDGYGVGTL